jgi:hypothetical protein
MPQLIKLKADEGEIVFSVRTPDDDSGFAGPVSDAAVATIGVGPLKSVFRTARSLSDAFASAIEGGKAKTAALELGLSLTGTGTVYVVEANATASITMTFNYSP